MLLVRSKLFRILVFSQCLLTPRTNNVHRSYTDELVCVQFGPESKMGGSGIEGGWPRGRASGGMENVLSALPGPSPLSTLNSKDKGKRKGPEKGNNAKDWANTLNNIKGGWLIAKSHMRSAGVGLCNFPDNNTFDISTLKKSALLPQMRKKTSWSKHNLPEELWPEILSWLPVQSLLRFRSVSRSWKAMIDDPQFARSHLNRFNKRHEPRLLFVHGPYSECVVWNSTTLRTNFGLGFLESNLESLHVLRTTPAPRSGGFMSWYVFSSIDGLFVLKPLTDGKGDVIDERGDVIDENGDVMLWNPSIRKTLTLPPLPGLEYVDFGFGFDPSLQDFKFVRLVFAETGVKSVAIYTLGANSWKSIEFRGDCIKDLMFYTTMRPIPLNGVVYTLAAATETLDKLISFDLSSELFSSFALPASAGHALGKLTTVDGGHTLAMVSMLEPEGSVWVLERLGDDTKSCSWIRRYSFVTQHEASDLMFLYIKKNDEMLLEWKNAVVSHNLKTQHEKIVLKTKKSFIHDCAFPYMESLILHH